MICKHCGSEIPEQPSKTVIINGIEYETETHDFDKTLGEITIPKGWRLWKASDFENFTLKDWDTLKIKDAWFFIQYPFAYNPNNYIARFFAVSSGACLSCGRGASDRDASLGVRFCRKVKKKGEMK